MGVQFQGDPWIHFCDGFFGVHYTLSNNIFVLNNCGAALIGGMFISYDFCNIKLRNPGTAVPQWLRCCATNRKVAGSMLDGIIGIFH